MSEKSKFTILSMMKDEGHSLVEWVAYHNHIGFDNICVFTNNCNDGTDDMLIRLEEMGYCHHFRNEVPEGKKPQPNALTLAEKNETITNTKWVLTMDADEFLSIKCGRGRVQDLEAAVPDDSDAIVITWRFFGSSGVTDWNPGLVIENYTHGAPNKFRKGWGVKTMFKPFEHMKFGIHRPRIKKLKQDPKMKVLLDKQLWVNGSGKPMHPEFKYAGWRSTGPSLGYDLVELNHYAVKSYEAYLLRRMRGNVNNKVDKYNASYFAIFDRNEEEASNCQRHARATRRVMDEILADPVMAELQEKALAYHADRVAQLRETGEYEEWLEELKLAGSTPITKLDEVLFTQHLPRVWQEKIKEMRAQGVPDKEIALMVARSTGAKMESRQQGLPQPADADGKDTKTVQSRKG